MIITGPNMSGKSTYIRQTAILVIMAQMGSYIPAKEAGIGLVDKIFTRIGAHDEILKGQSTFMVEMSETAGILNNLSPRSLVILDEIGRGTSTFDGLSLAWAIAEYLQKQKTRTLFATHFHELTVLAEDYPGVKNYNVAVKEWNDEIVFLHKIIPGSTDESYGIYVAKIAGIPQDVIQRSRQILTRLELSGKLHEKIRGQGQEEDQLSLFGPPPDPVLEEIREELENIDIDSLPPLSALNKIHTWKEKMEKNGKSPRPAA
jgi:DNA mismatch repair protein MutS